MCKLARVICYTVYYHKIFIFFSSALFCTSTNTIISHTPTWIYTSFFYLDGLVVWRSG